ncbi:MAG TPA: hypothetical protein VGK19_11115 [Capsulimonadaceae bacterium]
MNETTSQRLETLRYFIRSCTSGAKPDPINPKPLHIKRKYAEGAGRPGTRDEWYAD